MNAQSTCQVPMHDGDRCGRTGMTWLREDGTSKFCCICHAGFRGTDQDHRDKFQRELDRIIADSSKPFYDFTSFVFPKDGWAFTSDSFDRPVYFRKAKFEGDIHFSFDFQQEVDFREATFDAKVVFPRVNFRARVSFDGATFNGPADFRACRCYGQFQFAKAKCLSTLDFQNTIFKDEAVFNFCRFLGADRVNFFGAKFESQALFGKSVFMCDAIFRGTLFRRQCFFVQSNFNSLADFSCAEFADVSFSHAGFMAAANFTDCRFKGETNFTLCQFDSPEQTLFINNDLSRTVLMGCDLSKVELSLDKWNESGKWYCIRRRKVYDEVLNVGGELVAQEYRRLQVNYAKSYRFEEAGDFYIGEQEVIRKAKGRFRRFCCVSFLYKIVSYYGQSYKIPLFWVTLVLLVFPYILGLGGITVHDSHNLNGKLIVFEWSANPTDFLLFDRDYWRAFDANLDLVTFNRSMTKSRLDSAWQKLLVKLEFVLVVSLIAFFLLALRREFKRKSF